MVLRRRVVLGEFLAKIGSYEEGNTIGRHLPYIVNNK
jgi:hypothetical protein